MMANGHSPFDTRIFIKEARSLSDAGYEVSIIVPYKEDVRKDNISILATAPFKNGFDKLFISPLRILKRALQQNSESVYCIHDSDILITGVVLKLLGRKVIYDAHEDTPLQITYQHWIPKPLRKPYAWFYYLLEKLCGWMFDAIIVAEPVIAKYFPEKKTHLVRNFSFVSTFQNHLQVPYAERKKELIYIGTLSEARGLFEMLDAAKEAVQKIDFKFVLGGKFTPPTLEKQVIENYDVKFESWIQYDRLVTMFYEASVGIIIPNPIERYKTNYPVKMFEFMAAALPVIASREGESAEFVKEANCGILVDPMNVHEIAEAIVWLFAHPQEAEAMGKRGQALIFEKYNWEKESEVLMKVHQSI